MTVMQKKAHEPDRPPDRRGHRAARRRARRDPRRTSSTTAATTTRRTSARSSTPSASSSSAAAPCCWSRCSRRPGSSAPPACRSPRSSRTWRSATTSCTASGTGCATRRSTRPPGSGTTPRPSEQWKHSHNELHHTYTNVDRQGQRPRLRHHARRRGPALAPDLPRRSRCGTSSTPASSSTASRPTTSSSARTWRSQEAPQRARSSRPRAKQVLRKIRKPGHQGLRRAPAAVRPVVPAHPGRELHRQPGPQPVDPLGDHVRPLPRGRRDLRADARSTARPAASGTCARCSARPTSPAPRRCTS